MGSVRQPDIKRTPKRGIRNQFRAHLKSIGVVGKFRIEEMPDGTLLILGSCNFPRGVELPEFNGRIVRYKR